MSRTLRGMLMYLLVPKSISDDCYISCFETCEGNDGWKYLQTKMYRKIWFNTRI